MAALNVLIGVGILVISAYYVLKFFNETNPEVPQTNKLSLKGENLYSYLLKKCNVEYSWKKIDSYIETGFSYQNGRFMLRVFDDSTARLFYLIEPADVSRIRTVQAVANDLNRLSEYLHCLYSINSEENNINVWFSHQFVTISDETQMMDYFKAVLNDCFSASHYFFEQYSQAKDGDVVMENYETVRQNYLLFEQEIHHNSLDEDSRENLPVCSSLEREISLLSVLQVLFQIETNGIQQVKILEKEQFQLLQIRMTL